MAVLADLLLQRTGFSDVHDLISDNIDNIATNTTDIATNTASIAALPTLASGTYSPTLTNDINIDSSSIGVAQYSRVGNVCTVSGQVNINPTAGATPTRLWMSVPIASNFASSGQLGGSGSTDNGTPLRILADSTGNRAQFDYRADSAINQPYSFIFTYLIL